MDWKPHHYYEAAFERMEQSRAMLRWDEAGSKPEQMHSIGVYAAGLAVECMLRAFITRRAIVAGRTPAIDSRHNIPRLFKESGMWQLDATSGRGRRIPEEELDEIRRRLDGAVMRVHRLWRNEYRFACAAQIGSDYHELGEDEGIRGDVLKVNHRRINEAAGIVISGGTLLWDATRGSPRR